MPPRLTHLEAAKKNICSPWLCLDLPSKTLENQKHPKHQNHLALGSNMTEHRPKQGKTTFALGSKPPLAHPTRLPSALRDEAVPSMVFWCFWSFQGRQKKGWGLPKTWAWIWQQVRKKRVLVFSPFLDKQGANNFNFGSSLARLSLKALRNLSQLVFAKPPPSLHRKNGWFPSKKNEPGKPLKHS